jgi:hypothetical protein
MFQLELTHKRCATGEQRISELEGMLALLTEEVASHKDYIKLLEEKVVKITSLKHQVELDEHRLTQAQQRIKVNFLILLVLLLPENVMENSRVLYNHCKATGSCVVGRECTETIFL